MKITKVVYFPISRKNERQPLSKCDVVIDDCFLLKGIKIFDGRKGKYLVYPVIENNGNKNIQESEKENVEEYFHPVTRQTAEEFKEIIMEGYERVLMTGICVYKPR